MGTKRKKLPPPGSAFREWRLRNGLSMAQVGEKIGCTRQTVDRYEGGRMPEPPYLNAIVVLTDGEVDGNAWLGEEAANAIANRVSAG